MGAKCSKTELCPSRSTYDLNKSEEVINENAPRYAVRERPDHYFKKYKRPSNFSRQISIPSMPTIPEETTNENQSRSSFEELSASSPNLVYVDSSEQVQHDSNALEEDINQNQNLTSNNERNEDNIVPQADEESKHNEDTKSPRANRLRRVNTEETILIAKEIQEKIEEEHPYVEEKVVPVPVIADGETLQVDDNKKTDRFVPQNFNDEDVIVDEEVYVEKEDEDEDTFYECFTELPKQLKEAAEDYDRHIVELAQDVETDSSEDKNYMKKPPEILLYEVADRLKQLKRVLRRFDFEDKHAVENMDFKLKSILNELHKIEDQSEQISYVKHLLIEKAQKYIIYLHEKVKKTEIKKMKEIEDWEASNGGVTSKDELLFSNAIEKFQLVTSDLEGIRQQIIDYYGTSADEEFNQIRDKLDAAMNLVKSIETRGDFHIVISVEQYEDYIQRLELQFEKVVADNERDFEKDKNLLSNLNRSRSSRKRRIKKHSIFRPSIDLSMLNEAQETIRQSNSVNSQSNSQSEERLEENVFEDRTIKHEDVKESNPYTSKMENKRLTKFMREDSETSSFFSCDDDQVNIEDALRKSSYLKKVDLPTIFVGDQNHDDNKDNIKSLDDTHDFNNLFGDDPTLPNTEDKASATDDDSEKVKQTSNNSKDESIYQKIYYEEKGDMYVNVIDNVALTSSDIELQNNMDERYRRYSQRFDEVPNLSVEPTIHKNSFVGRHEAFMDFVRNNLEDSPDLTHSNDINNVEVADKSFKVPLVRIDADDEEIKDSPARGEEFKYPDLRYPNGNDEFNHRLISHGTEVVGDSLKVPQTCTETTEVIVGTIKQEEKDIVVDPTNQDDIKGNAGKNEDTSEAILDLKISNESSSPSSISTNRLEMSTTQQEDDDDSKAIGKDNYNSSATLSQGSSNRIQDEKLVKSSSKESEPRFIPYIRLDTISEGNCSDEGSSHENFQSATKLAITAADKSHPGSIRNEVEASTTDLIAYGLNVIKENEARMETMGNVKGESGFVSVMASDQASADVDVSDELEQKKVVDVTERLGESATSSGAEEKRERDRSRLENVNNRRSQKTRAPKPTLQARLSLVNQKLLEIRECMQDIEDYIDELVEGDIGDTYRSIHELLFETSRRVNGLDDCDHDLRVGKEKAEIRAYIEQLAKQLELKAHAVGAWDERLV